jgi:hypothetical protein
MAAAALKMSVCVSVGVCRVHPHQSLFPRCSLVVGDVNGQFEALAKRITTIMKKNGCRAVVSLFRVRQFVAPRF